MAAPVRRIRGVEELCDLFATPTFFETCSSLTGHAGLVVAWPGPSGELSAEERVRVLGGLAQLPCPSVALSPRDPDPAFDAVATGFDVVLDDPDDVAIVARAVEANPLAAQSLVQLLRVSASLDVHAGLLAESWVYSTLQAGPEFARWMGDREGGGLVVFEGASVRVERGSNRLEIWLARPERRNAFSREMRDDLWEALSLAVADSDLARIQLAGEGVCFSSGGDLDEFGTTPDPATAHAVRATRHPARLLHAVRDRTEAVVHGPCIGAGVELPAFASRVIARPDATFRLPEVSMGLVPGAGGTVSLPRRIGRQRTAWLALTGVGIDAETALAWRLVDEVAA